MAQHTGFQIVRRHTHAQEADLERRLAIPILSTALSGILDPSTGSTTTGTSSLAASSTRSTTSQTTTSSSGGSSESVGNSNSAGNTGSSTSSGSNTSASSGNGSASNSGGGNTNSAAGDSGTSDTGESVAAASQATAATAAAGVAGASSAAATPAAAVDSTATAVVAASATQAALSAAGLSSTSLVTQVSTAANGSVFTSVLPLGAIPTANPFGNIANSTAASSIAGVSGIKTQPTGTAANQDQDNSSGSSNAVRIAVPVAVVLGVLALGLLVAFFIRRQRKSMERDLQKPLMLSKNKTGLSTISAGAGAFGFTAAGFFKRGRRGSGYGQESSQGHGAPGVDHRSWLAGRPMSEEGMYADHTAYAQEYHGYNNDADQQESLGSGNHHYTEEMNGPELAAATGGSSRHDNNNNNPYSSNDQAYSRQSITSGEGGYLTASEEGADPFSNDNRSRDHFDGSASYGYSNPAARGLDAAAVQGATGGQTWSPYPELRRNSGNDNRNSITNTTPWEGGADMGEDFAPVTAESQAQYSPNRIMQHPQLNSSRWSG